MFPDRPTSSHHAVKVMPQNSENIIPETRKRRLGSLGKEISELIAHLHAARASADAALERVPEEQEGQLLQLRDDCEGSIIALEAVHGRALNAYNAYVYFGTYDYPDQWLDMPVQK